VRITRRRLLTLGGTAAVGLSLPRWSARAAAPLRTMHPEEGTAGYTSRPDLRPPPISIASPADGTAPGFIFLAPFPASAASTPSTSTPPPRSASHSGPLIVDDQGEVVWFLPMTEATAMNFRVQRFRGRPVLTWYEGRVLGPYGGSFVIYDPTYHQVARVKAGRGRHGDLHEFLLTRRGTALISVYSELAADLTSVGGPRDGRLVEGIVQEIDVATSRVLFEWRSSEHVSLDESYRTELTPAGNVDYFHLNSIDVDHDGHLLVSARHTSAIYKVDRRSGRVLWRLGGKKSDFDIGPGAAFRFQHDARRQADGSITIFDNGATEPGANVSSRGIRITLDMHTKRASLMQEYRTPNARAGWAMGNIQQLPDGGVFVGWGTDGSFSEFAPDGTLRFDARFADGQVGYRAFRLPWTARPTGKPAIGVTQNPGRDDHRLRELGRGNRGRRLASANGSVSGAAPRGRHDASRRIRDDDHDPADQRLRHSPRPRRLRQDPRQDDTFSDLTGKCGHVGGAPRACPRPLRQPRSTRRP